MSRSCVTGSQINEEVGLRDSSINDCPLDVNPTDCLIGLSCILIKTLLRLFVC